MWESWLRVYNNRQYEAVILPAGGKQKADYQTIMTRSFAEICRVLKSGRSLTLVFHKASNAVWAVIQEALLEAGLVVADVRGHGRGQGSYKQMTVASAVKTDLMISAYKRTESGVWEFVRTHLRQLPISSQSMEKLRLSPIDRITCSLIAWSHSTSSVA